jgi:hypothetical protein
MVCPNCGIRMQTRKKEWVDFSTTQKGFHLVSEYATIILWSTFPSILAGVLAFQVFDGSVFDGMFGVVCILLIVLLAWILIFSLLHYNLWHQIQESRERKQDPSSPCGRMISRAGPFGRRELRGRVDGATVSGDRAAEDGFVLSAKKVPSAPAKERRTNALIICHCPYCRTRHNVPAKLEGWPGKCGRCGKEVQWYP